MPNLLMHQADAYVPRSKVENTLTPSSTRSWRPIPHTRLLETVEANLKDKGFFITSQSHGLSHNHNRYFGLLEIRSSDEAEDYRSIIGVRNSHDKTFPAGVVLGSCVIVCSNLSFSGEISVARKHTRFIVRDLPELVHQAVDKLLSLRIAERNRITRYKDAQLTNLRAHDAVIRAVDSKIIAPSRIPHVLKEWRSPTHAEFTEHGKSAWRLFNAFSESWKGSNLQTLPGRSSKLQKVIDAACNRVSHHNVAA